jgi:hypothetical protein
MRSKLNGRMLPRLLPFSTRDAYLRHILSTSTDHKICFVSELVPRNLTTDVEVSNLPVD